ncbi:MAG: efflux RND transporter permease subunit [Bacteroidales bacterium]|nr:efflux RND transporter permease subunit [Bacteroidales bacterium]MDD4669538.1 efflux RND transporter permease subunit [Bacteroidales bacterium]
MLKNLIQRPVAVTMTIIAIVIVGVVSIGRLPISLMPSVDIPQITVQFTKSGASAREIDETIIKPLRQQLIQVPSLRELKCEANYGGGNIFMQFAYDSDIDFNFIEVNEKVDRALQSLPKEIERPKVIKASATDIPVFFINITATNQSTEKFMELGRFAKEVISKRIEQIPQVALVDISGILGSQMIIEPDNEKLTSLGINAATLERAISANNISLGNLSIKDGYYRWNIRFDSEIRSQSDIENIFLNIDGRIYRFKEIASVHEEAAQASGTVWSDGKRAVTMAVIKQSDAQMSDLRNALLKLMDNFEKEYQGIDFEVTRNQTELLDYSIDNLKSNILVGALLAILIIFLFMKDFRSPILVTITIPLSLIVSLLSLYLLGISINIISLSGLILGIGMMVDNSIIVIDNITQHWERGEPLKEAIVSATSEVVMPMISSVLTTCAVFIPLIFLSGIAGALFYDQAMGVTVALVSSLVVAVLVIPVYFLVLYKHKTKVEENHLLKRLHGWDFTAAYERGLKWVFRHQKLAWCIFLMLIAGSACLFVLLPKSKLPPLTHDEIVFDVDWNQQITIEESGNRALALISDIEHIKQYDIMVGKQDFLLSHTGDISASQVKFYIKADSPKDLEKIEPLLTNRLKTEFPEANYGISNATNIFNLIFSEDEADLVSMIKNRNGKAPEPDELNRLLGQIKSELPDVYIEPVLWQEQILFITNQEKMSLYGLTYNDIYSTLSRATKENTLFSITSGTFAIPVRISDNSSERDLLSLQVKNEQGVYVPLSYVLSERRVRDMKSVVSGKDGDYYPLNIMAPDKDIPIIVETIDRIAHQSGEYSVTHQGAYFSDRAMIKELMIVLIISLLLLFFILAAQFESIIQPFIILSEIAADFFGALFALLLCGSGINLMSLIGIVVMCGIVINDSILKVDTINQLRKSGLHLIHAIMLAGSRRLKPIIMTSLTTILAIAPFLIRGDMGSDLQFPLSVALIGGMILGTVVSIFFIPVLYYEIYRRRR